MTVQKDAILQKMTELTDAVKGAESTSDLQWEEVQEKFGDQMKSMVATQVAEAEAARPAYTSAAEQFGAMKAFGAVDDGNQYKSILANIAADGFSRSGSQKIKAVDFAMAHTFLQKAHSLMPDRVAAPSDDLAEAVKAAMTSTGSATGDELVPTGMASSLWEDIHLMSSVVSNLTTIDMPTNPFDVPQGLGDITWAKGTENIAGTAQAPATAKSTLTATELFAEVNWSYTLDEDSVVALMPAIRERVAVSGAELIDAFALNADATNAGTGNINLDDADPADTIYYLSAGQDGIRHQWIVDNTDMAVAGGGDAFADADMLSALGSMGKYAANPDDVLIITDPKTYLKGLIGATNVRTLDKFGPEATILTGQLGAYGGMPIIVSASHPLGEADGKVSTTAGNNTLGSISVVNRRMWYAGFRRDLLIEVDRDIQKRMWIMVISLRQAVAAHGTRATNTHTAGILNLLVA